MFSRPPATGRISGVGVGRHRLTLFTFPPPPLQCPTKGSQCFPSSKGRSPSLTNSPSSGSSASQPASSCASPVDTAKEPTSVPSLWGIFWKPRRLTSVHGSHSKEDLNQLTTAKSCSKHSVMPNPIPTLSPCRLVNNGGDDCDLDLLIISGYSHFDHPSILFSTTARLLSFHVSGVWNDGGQRTACLLMSSYSYGRRARELSLRRLIRSSHRFISREYSSCLGGGRPHGQRRVDRWRGN